MLNAADSQRIADTIVSYLTPSVARPSELEFIGIAAVVVLVAHLLRAFVLPEVVGLSDSVWSAIRCGCANVWQSVKEATDAVWTTIIGAIRRVVQDLRDLRNL